VKTALFKLKKDADPAKVKQWQTLAESMVGVVSGTFSSEGAHLNLQKSPNLEHT
jgi:hypothetical protein